MLAFLLWVTAINAKLTNLPHGAAPPMPQKVLKRGHGRGRLQRSLLRVAEVTLPIPWPFLLNALLSFI
jgi:hypothetical protein